MEPLKTPQNDKRKKPLACYRIRAKVVIGKETQNSSLRKIKKNVLIIL
jgi:hypothetical protein